MIAVRHWLVLIAAGAALVSPAMAGSSRPGSLGGGFIELIMTGRDPTPDRGRAEPSPAAVPDQPQPDGQRGWRTASLPEPEPGPVTPLEGAFDPRFERQEVAYESSYAPGTVVIDTPAKFLYLVQPGGKALRYGIGVGRPGFTWSGVKTITRKAEWPDWIPPAEMLMRRPDLPRHLAGGPQNPLGARAMYLGSSLYRIHGTNEPETIGRNVSSGCIRLLNEDVTDLYGRVKVGTTVIVL